MTPDKNTSESYFVALVDDEPRIHEAVIAMLTEAGMLRKHVSYHDPLSFIAFLKEAEEVPDLVLLDIHFESSGLSGVEILPFIREDYPYLPVILLSGMDADALQEAEEYPCTYFIPKPVSKDHLTKMIRFYMGKSQKSGELIEQMSDELKDFQEYLALIETEMEQLQVQPEEEEEAQQPEKKKSKKGSKPFEKIQEILSSLLNQSEIMPSFVSDLEDIYRTQFNLFKKVIEVLVRFDVAESVTPGLDIHKHKGTDHVYSARLSVKVRLYYYKSAKSTRKKLLRLDTAHGTKFMDKWLKNNYSSYAD